MEQQPRQSDTHADPHSFEDQASRLAELGSLATMLAHEINNLLTKAQGRVQLALRQNPEGLMHPARRSLDFPKDPHREALELVNDILHQTTRLADSMMQYASPSVEAEPSDTPRTEIRVAHVNARGLLAPHGSAEKHSSLIEYETSWNTDGYHAGIDPVALEQVLLNVYLNAEGAIRAQQELDANAPGLIIVSSSIECSTWNTPTVRITVQDTGVGIAPADLETIFEPWKQGDMLVSRKKGFGLGLAVCQKLISEAGGSISCDSAPGVGSRFTITLPAISAEQDSLDADDHTTSGLAA
jgi:signal transduction histidine kinase